MARDHFVARATSFILAALRREERRDRRLGGMIEDFAGRGAAAPWWPYSGGAHGHGPHPITNGERTLLSAWLLKQGAGPRLANVVGEGRLSLTDFLPEVRK